MLLPRARGVPGSVRGRAPPLLARRSTLLYVNARIAGRQRALGDAGTFRHGFFFSVCSHRVLTVFSPRPDCGLNAA